MVGVWIEPVTAQVMMTLSDFAAIVSSPGLLTDRSLFRGLVVRMGPKLKHLARPVMRGLDPRIHLLRKKVFKRRWMDCRVKPGNDDLNLAPSRCAASAAKRKRRSSGKSCQPKRSARK